MKEVVRALAELLRDLNGRYAPSCERVVVGAVTGREDVGVPLVDYLVGTREDLMPRKTVQYQGPTIRTRGVWMSMKDLEGPLALNIQDNR